jgi:hypothetical protein
MARRPANLRVTYVVNNDENTFLVMFPPGKLVGDLLDTVRERQGMPDLCSVSLNGEVIDNGEPFDDWYRHDAVFRVARSEEPGRPSGSA